jgi:hypothetical protein
VFRDFIWVAEVDMSKFADEDQEEEEEPKSYHIKPQVRRVQGAASCRV